MVFRIIVVLLAGLLIVKSGCLDVGREPAPESKTPATSPESAKPKDPWASHTQGLPFIFGFMNGIDESIATEKPVMFFFTTTRCGYCKKLAKESFTDPEIKTLLERFILVIVDCDDPKQQPYTKKLDINGLPFILFKSPEGNTLAIVHGYKPKMDFWNMVVQAVNSLEYSKKVNSKTSGSGDESVSD